MAPAGKVRPVSCALGEPLVKSSKGFLAKFFAGIPIKFLPVPRRFLLGLPTCHTREQGCVGVDSDASWARW